MRLWVKIGLFLSAYLPLFLILAINNWFNLYITGLFVIILVISLIWFVVVFIVKRTTRESYHVVNVENKAKDALNYVIPYIISFISLDLSKWQDSIALAILLVIIFVVYVQSELLYINPLLFFFGYSLYSLEVCKPSLGCEETKTEITIIAKRKISKSDRIEVWEIDEGIAWEN
ncbi:MAG: hypothetical protein QMD46_08085 [Methanomicrobiales archaeon]|nr:hypothetical protein [Methanomicrobiales archaeon]MDI6877672.1 hypothetical protein [Methanomicrobiales archaeon]